MMNGSIIRLVFGFIFLPFFAQGMVKSSLSSQFLARGERAVLEIRVEGSEPSLIPRIPEVVGLDVESLGSGPPRMLPGRRLEYGFQYVISSYTVGEYEIPPIEVEVRGKRFKTAALRVEIFDPTELSLGAIELETGRGGARLQYGSILKTSPTKIFKNQTVEAELKIYVPMDVARSVVDWGVPEFKRDGLAVWRFEASGSRGQLNLLGKQYVSLSYPTTMTALRDGEVSVGPATVRLTYINRLMTQFGVRSEEAQVTLEIAEKALTVEPLPDGAPEGFDNAVGKFTLGTAIAQTEVREGEPLEVDVVVSGRGNLDNLRSPKLLSEAGWKVYDSTQKPRGDERRFLDGTVVFNQFIRPLEMKTKVPPFRLVYFDPELEEYKTVTTESIPLQMTASAKAAQIESSGPPQALSMPVERMTDILGVIRGGQMLSKTGGGFPFWVIHVLGGLTVLGLIIRLLWLRFGHVFTKDERKAEMKRDWEEVSAAVGTGSKEFLRKAGRFVEKWMPDQETEVGREVLERRDDLCFREDVGDDALPKEKQSQLARGLRKAVLGSLVFLLTFGAGEGKAEDALELYDSAKFEKAAEAWLKAGTFETLSADALYNIGNSAYRMGAVGQAALYYRRALVKEEAHQEARQNLRFIERKYGSLTIDRPAYQYTLARLPIGLWKGIFWSGFWIICAGLLVFPVTQRRSSWRVVGIVGLVLGPVFLGIAAFGWRYYPDDARFAEVEKQAVIVGEGVMVYTDAARTSPEVIDAPPGSIAEVVKRSGEWVYIAFATETRGWVPEANLEMIIPKGAMKVPELRKAPTDGSSA